MTSRLLFFVSDHESESSYSTNTASIVSWQFWRPSLTRIVPPGNPVWPFVIWWGLHMFRVFQNSDYCVVLYFENDTLVHRSVVFPGFYRFPFMTGHDLQVGGVWTAPGSRNKGIAGLALVNVIAHFSGRRIWYLCDESNPASIAVATKAGMRLHAIGTRTRQLGLYLLGQFRIVTVTEDELSQQRSSAFDPAN
jgi:RimJ/RimL family protein N-acetyltransferase